MTHSLRYPFSKEEEKESVQAVGSGRCAAFTGHLLTGVEAVGVVGYLLWI